MILPFAIALFSSAALMFWAELMFSKMLLPIFGGTPSVWSTSMMFYQAALLAGYAFAHLSVRTFPLWVQAATQLVLLYASYLLLPIAIPESMQLSQEAPISHILTLLFTVVGLPLFTLSVTTPLLQYWFSHTRHRQAENPYILYAASNAGSMLGLIAYPILMEPMFTLSEQSLLWEYGFATLIVFTAIPALITLTYYKRKPDSLAFEGELIEERTPWSRKLRWIGLAFVPSSLMLGLTTLFTVDIAAIPMFWMLPLAIYLLTFILSFREKEILPHDKLIKLQIYLLAPIILILLGEQFHISGLFLAPWMLVAIFVNGMACHRELYLTRPGSRHLTEFYFFLSLGGLLGGFFNGFAAILIFDGFHEVPLTIAIAALLTARTVSNNGQTPASRWKDLAILLGFFAVLVSISAAAYYGARSLNATSILAGWLLVINFLALKFCFDQVGKPFRLGASLLIMYITGSVAASISYDITFTERSFFGTHKIKNYENRRVLKHGSTLHGIQLLAAEKRLTPTSYFHKNGPLGQIFSTLLQQGSGQSIGLVGLGAGTITCLAQKEDHFTLYEIDPLVIKIATNPDHFTFLKDCPPTHNIILGDARLALRNAGEQEFDVLILDAFSSDAIPVHLMTQEAFKLYQEKLKPEGILILNVSNAFIDLRPVLANIADAMGFTAYSGVDIPSGEDADEYRLQSAWVVMAKNPERLSALTSAPRWEMLKKDDSIPVWTDDYSNILQLLKFN